MSRCLKKVGLSVYFQSGSDSTVTTGSSRRPVPTPGPLRRSDRCHRWGGSGRTTIGSSAFPTVVSGPFGSRMGGLRLRQEFRGSSTNHLTLSDPKEQKRRDKTDVVRGTVLESTRLLVLPLTETTTARSCPSQKETCAPRPTHVTLSYRTTLRHVESLTDKHFSCVGVKPTLTDILAILLLP